MMKNIRFAYHYGHLIKRLVITSGSQFAAFLSLKIFYLCIMIIEVLKSKLHRAKVTQAELNYVGSITIDEDLMDAANIIANEKVQIVNNNNGARFETYVIRGERGTGTICLNGATARLAQVGDIVIIMSYAYMEVDEARKYEPILIFPDGDNKLIK
jgi:aspartate 1-decarboxylase